MATTAEAAAPPSVAFVRSETAPALPPPASAYGPLAWLRAHLFSSPGNAALTVGILLLLAAVIPPTFQFLVTDAVWSGTERSACRAETAGRPVGACWAFIRDRFPYFVYGSYPVGERWRVDLFFVLLAFGAAWMLWLRAPRRAIGGGYFFVLVPILSFVLLTGGNAEFRTFLAGHAYGFDLSVIERPIASGVEAPLGWLGRLGTLLNGAIFPLSAAVLTVLRVAAAILLAPLALVGAAVRDLPPPWSFWLDVLLTSLVVSGAAALAAARAGRSFRSVYLATLGAFALGAGLLALLDIDWGLEPVPTALWGGLLVTVLVASVGIILSLPLGILLALGRRSRLPVVRFLSVVFIEVVRGVPLITVLIMANAMLPLFLPVGWSVDRLLRPLIGVSLFAAAYMAEVVRGGLQAIPRGQYEGAKSLGLGYWQSTVFIILPQALKVVVPGIVSTFIGLFKDTTLVAIVGLFDFVRTIEASRADPIWAAPTISTTGYAFAALFYFVCCYGMSRYSLMVERRLAAGDRR